MIHEDITLGPVRLIRWDCTLIVPKMARMGYSARHERIRTLIRKGASKREVVRITGWSRGLVRHLISQMEAGL